jgi:hypothetical protein
MFIAHGARAVGIKSKLEAKTRRGDKSFVARIEFLCRLTYVAPTELIVIYGFVIPEASAVGY